MYILNYSSLSLSCLFTYFDQNSHLRLPPKYLYFNSPPPPLLYNLIHFPFSFLTKLQTSFLSVCLSSQGFQRRKKLISCLLFLLHHFSIPVSVSKNIKKSMMEEAVPSLKRQREEEEETALVDGEFVEEALKRQKSYKDIISILEEDEYEPNEDISSLLTTLQQEISPSSSSSSSESSISDNPNTSAAATTETHSSPTLEHCTSFSSKDEYEEDGERVMRHLLEASDDELGIPNSDVVTGAEESAAAPVVGEDLMNGCGFGVGADFDFGVGGIWEFEDDTANYYAMLQSELFLGAGV